jgi:hypothetical protein
VRVGGELGETFIGWRKKGRGRLRRWGRGSGGGCHQCPEAVKLGGGAVPGEGARQRGEYAPTH